MGKSTTIPWCHHTFNGWRGCAKVSAGCEHCYAELLSRRNPAIFGTWGAKGARVVASESMWCQPHAWNSAAKRAGERRRVFCLSLGDWLEAWDQPLLDAKARPLRTRAGEWPWAAVTPASPLRKGQRLVTMHDARARLLWTIATTPHLDWLLLTKRPERWSTALSQINRDLGCYGVIHQWIAGEPPDNVWVGVSVEDQRRADERIPKLLAIPAKVRFLSVEPILGPVDLSSWLFCDRCRNPRSPCGRGAYMTPLDNAAGGCWFRECGCSRIDWVIVGGESGPNHRPCQVEWIEDVVEQCRDASTAVFVKQDSGLKPERQGRIPDWAWALKQTAEARP